MDLVYRLNSHSWVSTRFRRIFQPITYSLLGAMVNLALLRHNVKIIDHSNFLEAYSNRPVSQPLITVSNHHSCLDDFILFGTLLSLKQLTDGIPVWRTVRDRRTGAIVERGGGVDQPSMDFALDVLNHGQWVHVFPQGRVVDPDERDKEALIRLRWGVGRLASECKQEPLIIPIWHCGFDAINPSTSPTLLRTLACIFGRPKYLTITVGRPISLSELRSQMYGDSDSFTTWSKEERTNWHTCVTDVIQSGFYSLKTIAENNHRKHSKRCTSQLK